MATFDAILKRARCWHCLRYGLERRATSLASAAIDTTAAVPVRIVCGRCGAAREFAVPVTMGPAGVAIVERQWLWIVHQRARLVCLLMALALRGAA
jgi:hypothetical protein